MRTKKYIITVTATNYEHTKIKKRIAALFNELNSSLVADMDFYTVPIENPGYRSNGLYGLGTRNNLTTVGINYNMRAK